MKGKKVVFFSQNFKINTPWRNDRNLIKPVYEERKKERKEKKEERKVDADTEWLYHGLPNSKSLPQSLMKENLR